MGSTITHFILLPNGIEDENSSFFQGFARELFDEYIHIVGALASFPHDILEIAARGGRYVSSRLYGSSLAVELIQARYFRAEIIFGFPLTVLWSSESTVDFVAQEAAKLPVRPIHISTASDPRATELSTLDETSIRGLLVDLWTRAATVDGPLAEALHAYGDQALIERNEGPLGVVPLGHNCVAPLVSTLRGVGYLLEKVRNVQHRVDSSEHIEGMLELAREVDRVRSRNGPLLALRKNDAIVYCPANQAYLYDASSRMWNELYRRLDKSQRNFLKNGLIRNRGFGNATMNTAVALKNPYEDNIIGPLLIERQKERRLMTNVVSVVASNQLAPAYRFPEAVMLHHDRLKTIAEIANSNKRDYLQQLGKKISSYSAEIKREIGDELFGAVFSNREMLLAICDFPIEWLSIQGTPAMFTHEISRIPMTPGNLFVRLALSVPRLDVPVSMIQNVLVIRSFQANDPIRSHVQFAIDHFRSDVGLDNMNIRIVDVSSTNELIGALNEFTGTIVIFDCHGDHGGERSHGWLHIGNEKVDVWALGGKCRMPPIVILSACSTYAIDGSHASVANGFFRCGALSVLGTFAPIDSKHASIFIGRLLYRLSAYVTLIARHRPITWRQIMSGFFRMSYVTDVLRTLVTDGRLNEAAYRDLHIEANGWINSFDPEWVQKLRQGISNALGVDQAAVEKLLLDQFQFVETMLFVQLGRPECLIVSRQGDSSFGDSDEGEPESMIPEIA